MLKEKRESIPSQTGDGSEDVELRTANDKVDDHHHEDRAGFGTGGFVQDFDDGVHGGCVGDFFEIAKRKIRSVAVVGVDTAEVQKRNVPKAEEKDNDESEANNTTGDGSPDHRKRNLPRSILDLIGHVEDRIVSADGEDDCQQADAPLNTLVLPATLAVKGSFENKVRRAPSRHDDQNDDKHDEAEDVQDSSRNLKRREDPPGVDVAEDGQSHRRPRKQHVVPALGNVR